MTIDEIVRGLERYEAVASVAARIRTGVAELQIRVAEERENDPDALYGIYSLARSLEGQAEIRVSWLPLVSAQPIRTRMHLSGTRTVRSSPGGERTVRVMRAGSMTWKLLLVEDDESPEPFAQLRVGWNGWRWTSRPCLRL